MTAARLFGKGNLQAGNTANSSDSAGESTPRERALRKATERSHCREAYYVRNSFDGSQEIFSD